VDDKIAVTQTINKIYCTIVLLEVNPEKTKCILISHSQKIGQRHSIKIANRSFEDVAKFKNLGTTLTDQNCMHKEIKSRLNSGDTCYHSVQSSVLPPAV
jgi:glycerol-3-phosphate O-acyltransferase